MAYFPFMIDIEEKRCLVVGGGNIAFHKVKILVEFGVHIRVVATEVCKELTEFIKAERKSEFEIVQREFQEDDLAGIDFVVAATDEEQLNYHISELCRQKNILVNAVDMKEACSFIFPAMIQDKDLLLAVSTGGKSPAAAGYMKNRIKKYIPEYYGAMVDALGGYREYILEQVPTAKERKEIFNQLLEYGDFHEGEIPLKIVDKIIAEVTGQVPI